MGWVMTLVVGGVIGWLASIVTRTKARMGLIASVLVGIVGSLMGSSVAVGLGIAPAGSVMSFLIALAGAIALIFILRALGIFTRA